MAGMGGINTISAINTGIFCAVLDDFPSLLTARRRKNTTHYCGLVLPEESAPLKPCLSFNLGLTFVPSVA